MRLRNSMVVAILLILIGYLPCVAGVLPVIKEGAHVRIKAPGSFKGWLVGDVVGLNDKIIILHSKDQGALSPIPLDAITRFERGLGKKSRMNMVGKSAGVGLLCGAGLGFLMGIVTNSNDYEPYFNRGEVGVILGVVGGAIGVSAGTLFGVLGSRSERWERVPLEHIRVSILPQHQGGLTLAASFTF